MSNFIKKVEHPETGECVEAEFLDDYFGKHNYGLRLPDGRVFGEGCLAICKTEEGKYEGTELLTDHIHQKGKMVEPQGKSVVEDWEKEIKANGHNWIQQDKMIPFIKNLQKETDEKSYERGLEDGRGIEKRLNAEKLKETDDKWKRKINGLIDWIELMDWECFEQEQIKKDILDQATSIIKEVTAS